MSELFHADAYVRAYTERPAKRSFEASSKRKKLDEPSEWSLIFDCETTVDPAQAVRFGFFQVRKGGALCREGIFHDRTALTSAEFDLLLAYAARHGLDTCSLEEFRIKVLLRVGYEAGGQIIGFNLPFDISRVARDWGEARGSLRGGFSFELTRNYNDPHIRVKHLSSTTALIDFAKPAGQETGRGMRRRGNKIEPHRGYFYDLRTLGSALHSQKFSLARLAKFLDTATKKHEGITYDGPLTEAFLDYGRADVQATWECFEKLRDLYASYGLSTPLHRIQSEASIGKACLKDMGIAPLLACQPDISRKTFGHIMSAYFGGRAEIRIRREVRQVMLCDFKAMYPTVNTLMGLWSFLIADGYTTEDSTEATQTLLDNFEVGDLQNLETWRRLATLVSICPQDDALPLRTQYSPNRDALTIGLNHVSWDQSLWYTLADVLASKVLTGRTPVIERAITFRPGPRQLGLRPLNLLGQPAFRVDPQTEDGFKWLVDMRDIAIANGDPAKQAIKIIVNSTSYGTFAEVNRDDAPKPEAISIFGPDGACISTSHTAIEQPGKFFHPLLATLITGAARLMLAATERVATDKGLDWVFCDTDSMAMAKPKGMANEEFYARCKAVVDWFGPLNPYAKAGSILKIEDINYRVKGGELEPLFAYAISAKRYALFNMDIEGRPVIRKLSAHGLGHLMDPYPETDPAIGIPDPIVSDPAKGPDPARDVRALGGKRWQYDFWFHILTAALAGAPNNVRRDYHPALNKPALSHYGATSPALLRWLKHFNEGKDYASQVKPFGFLDAFMARAGAFATEQEPEFLGEAKRGRPSKARTPKPIAPYERDPAIGASRAFDRETGEAVPLWALRTYAEALAPYHLSPEDKFENGRPFDVGRTERRHLRIGGVRLIGKEANRVDETGNPVTTNTACVKFC